MWSQIFAGYSLFILKMATAFLGLLIFLALIKGTKKMTKSQNELVITDLSEQYKENADKLKEVSQLVTASKKEKKKQKKAEQSAQTDKPCLYVLDFNGDTQASQVAALKEEISSIIQVAKPGRDQVLLRLESPGGVVHGYGFAASQLMRLKEHGIELIVAVDKVAASGGYMMACVADKLVAAPFAVIGSVGVVAQVPNIHRLLKKHDIDVDIMTAGEYKRTLTVTGENTEKGKAKFQEELEDTHQLFKDFVIQHRPQLAIDQIATGEHWYGQQALALNLVDDISTSDDLILQAIPDKSVLALAYKQKKPFLKKMAEQGEESLDNLLVKWLSKDKHHFF